MHPETITPEVVAAHNPTSEEFERILIQRCLAYSRFVIIKAENCSCNVELATVTSDVLYGNVGLCSGMPSGLSAK